MRPAAAVSMVCLSHRSLRNGTLTSWRHISASVRCLINVRTHHCGLCWRKCVLVVAFLLVLLHLWIVMMESDLNIVTGRLNMLTSAWNDLSYVIHNHSHCSTSCKVGPSNSTQQHRIQFHTMAHFMMAVRGSRSSALVVPTLCFRCWNDVEAPKQCRPPH